MICEIEATSELLQSFDRILAHLKRVEDAVTGLYEVWHTFVAVAEEHFASARVSRKQGEPDLWF